MKTKIAHTKTYAPFMGVYQGLIAEIIKRDPYGEIRDGSYLRNLVADLTVDDVVSRFPSYDKEFLRLLEDWPSVGDAEMLAFCNRFPLSQLRGYFERAVFNGLDESMRLFRTLLRLVYKLKVSHTNDQEKAAVARFKENNDACFDRDSLGYNDCDGFAMVARAAAIVQECVGPSLIHEPVLPSHGPGAVLEQHKAWAKSAEPQYFEAAEEFFPASEHLCVDQLHYLERIELAQNVTWGVTPLKWQEEVPCRLSMVPKDARGPRAICTHPTNIMMVQQGQRRVLQAYIDRHLGKQIVLADQSVNADLATKGVRLDYATIDLTDASDRIGVGLVRRLFGDEVFEWLRSTRATDAYYRGRHLTDLSMFAPMGSALCFPVECLVFYAVTASIVEIHGGDRTDVYVYGDDIICPGIYAKAVMEGLRWFGFKPNENKSYYQGFFRESCGNDVFQTRCITPLQMKEVLRSDSIESWGAWSDAARRCHTLNWPAVATAIGVALEQCVGYGRLPVIPHGMAAIGYPVPIQRAYETKRRWSGDLLQSKSKTGYQTLQYRVMQLHPETAKVLSHTRECVRDALVAMELRDRPEGERIEVGQDAQYALPKRMRAKYGWTDHSCDPRTWVW